MAIEFKRNTQIDVLIDLMVAYKDAEDGPEWDASVEAESLLRTLLRIDPQRMEYLIALAQHGTVHERGQVLLFLNLLDSDPDGDADTNQEYQEMLLLYNDGIEKAVSVALHSDNATLRQAAGMVATLGLANPKDDLPILKQLAEETPDPSMQVMVNYLSYLPNNEKLAAMVEFAKHPDWEVRINALQNLGDEDEAYLHLGLLMSMIQNDPEPRVRDYACEVADRMLHRYSKQIEVMKDSVAVSSI